MCVLYAQCQIYVDINIVNQNATFDEHGHLIYNAPCILSITQQKFHYALIKYVLHKCPYSRAV